MADKSLSAQIAALVDAGKLTDPSRDPLTGFLKVAEALCAEGDVWLSRYQSHRGEELAVQAAEWMRRRPELTGFQREQLDSILKRLLAHPVFFRAFRLASTEIVSPASSREDLKHVVTGLSKERPASVLPLPVLSDRDLTLALQWCSPSIKNSVLAAASRNWSIRREVSERRGKDWDIGCMISARSAERAVRTFYESLGREVNDVSVEQLAEPNDGSWRIYDLRVGDQPIDVKNARRAFASGDRYVEHTIKRYKRFDDSGVTLVGVVSPYLWPEQLLHHTPPPTRASVVVLGETSADKHASLANAFNDPAVLELTFHGDERSGRDFLPPWLFDYPGDAYENRDALLSRFRAILSEGPVEYDGDVLSQQLIPVCIASGLDPLAQVSDCGMDAWEAAFVRRLSARLTQLGYSLPVVFLSILEHGLGMLAARDLAPSKYDPSRYRDLIFFGSYQHPIALFDPLRTVAGIIEALDALWRYSLGSTLANYRKFRMLGFNILQGQALDSGDWRTLYAYCGGRMDDGTGAKCGKNPLVLGQVSSCQTCHRLVCPTCRFCATSCDRCYAPLERGA